MRADQRGPIVLALFALTFLLSACTRGAPPPVNVLLISIDSLRADHLGAYGHDRGTSPSIDALCRESAVFLNAISQAPWTLPAHVSLLTSQYGRTHRVDHVRSKLAEDIPTIASVLAEEGYDTAAVVSGPFMKRRYGMNAGFRHYDDSLATGRIESHRIITSPSIHERATALLNRLQPPFFLFLHYWDVHYDYIPPTPYDRVFDDDYTGAVTSHDFERSTAVHAGMDPRDLTHIVALYDGEIRHLDAYLGQLFGELRRRGLMESTLIVLTADHGDEFFEHGEKGHSHSVYEELVRVPLIVRPPGGIVGLAIEDAVEHIDVFPTILDFAEIERPTLALRGRSFLRAVFGDALKPHPIFTETNRFRRRKARRTPYQKAESVRLGDLKLIRHGNARYPDEIYDLKADPGESKQVKDSDTLRLLEEELTNWHDANPRGEDHTGPKLDPTTREQLETLGYVD